MRTNTESVHLYMVGFPINVYCHVNFHVQVDDKVVLWILGLSLMFCLPQSVICKQWKCWPWRNAAPMVKRIMGEGVVINSSFLCSTLISSREFQQGLGKQNRRLRSKGKPKVRPITVNIYSPITGPLSSFHMTSSTSSLLSLFSITLSLPFILSGAFPQAWLWRGYPIRGIVMANLPETPLLPYACPLIRTSESKWVC